MTERRDSAVAALAEPKPKKPPDYEQLLADQIAEAGLPTPERQCRFEPRRRWRADFAWVVPRIIVEVEGRSWHPAGRQNRTEMEKSNEAQLLGWKFLRVPSDHVVSGEAIALLRRVLEGER